MQLIMLGPPGAGKGTQAEYFQKKLLLCKLSTGDMLRDAVKQGTEIGRQADAVMKSGQLVSDAIVIQLIRERIIAMDCDNGFILDGFPRTITQAGALDRTLEELGKPLTMVVELTVNDNVLVERVAGRFACAKCGAGYHDVFKPTQHFEICDICGSTDFTRRKDDNRETVTSRLKAYHAQTAPLLPYYRARGILRSVDGMADIAAVTKDIEALLT